MNLEAAAAYAERHQLHALLVQQGDRIVFERYGGGYDAEKPHALYSGTKSFWGVGAVAAQDDGLLDLDEHVGASIPSWSDGEKAAVTLRMLLQLIAGIGFGGLGSAVPSYERALGVALKDAPGTTFTYGGIPLQVFGAVFAHKLASRGLSPHEYLGERIFGPLGLRVGAWRTLKDGTQPLPTGAFVTAREWRKFGLLVRDRGMFGGAAVVRPESLATCFVGSDANPRYGLCWWLSPLREVPDVVYAGGAAGQALYVIPSENAVVVKFGGSASYKHDAFLKRLLAD
ncbi:MAG TPA: serine hydrolase domain-containing protein [Candidatus Limnocylindria bacterium]|jgi:CubicO group peptidase (beta-lactamase class C family)|nr:serine hydrolase domain-containing protein [Candidatus Limnocylindria bacterium]